MILWEIFFEQLPPPKLIKNQKIWMDPPMN